MKFKKKSKSINSMLSHFEQFNKSWHFKKIIFSWHENKLKFNHFIVKHSQKYDIKLYSIDRLWKRTISQIFWEADQNHFKNQENSFIFKIQCCWNDRCKFRLFHWFLIKSNILEMHYFWNSIWSETLFDFWY